MFLRKVCCILSDSSGIFVVQLTVSGPYICTSEVWRSPFLIWPCPSDMKFKPGIKPWNSIRGPPSAVHFYFLSVRCFNLWVLSVLKWCVIIYLPGKFCWHNIFIEYKVKSVDLQKFSLACGLMVITNESLELTMWNLVQRHYELTYHILFVRDQLETWWWCGTLRLCLIDLKYMYTESVLVISWLQK